MSVTPIPSHEKTVNWFTLTQAINYTISPTSEFEFSGRYYLPNRLLFSTNGCVLVTTVHYVMYWFSTFVLILIFFVNCSFQNIHCFPFSSLWTEPSFGSSLWSHFVLLRRPHWTALFAIVLNRLQYVHICIHTHHVGTGSIWAFLFYLRRGRLA